MLSHALRRMSRRADRRRRSRAASQCSLALAILLWSVAGSRRAAAGRPAAGARRRSQGDLGLRPLLRRLHGEPVPHRPLAASSIGAGIVAGGPYGCAEAATPLACALVRRCLPPSTGRAVGCMLGSHARLAACPTTGTLEAQRPRARAVAAASIRWRACRAPASTSSPARTIDVVEPAVVDAAAGALREPRRAARPTSSSSGTTRPATPSSPRTRASPAARRTRPYITDCDYDQAGDILRAHLRRR